MTMKLLNAKATKLTATATMVLLMTACTTLNAGSGHRPIVDGGDLANYETDLTECQAVAEQRDYVNDETKSDAAIGAAVGALAGAGGDRGDIVGGAIVGAVVGAGSKAYDVRTERKNIVINCMRNRGYNTVESTSVVQKSSWF